MKTTQFNKLNKLPLISWDILTGCMHVPEAIHAFIVIWYSLNISKGVLNKHVLPHSLGVQRAHVQSYRDSADMG